MRPIEHIQVRANALRNSVMVIFTEIYDLASRHKKKTIAVILFELWVHSLALQHIDELKSLLELIPFFKK